MTDNPGVAPAADEALLAVATDALVAHQRMGASDCLCGPQRLGSSFAQHQAGAVLARLAPLLSALVAARAASPVPSVPSDTAVVGASDHLTGIGSSADPLRERAKALLRLHGNVWPNVDADEVTGFIPLDEDTEWECQECGEVVGVGEDGEAVIIAHQADMLLAPAVLPSPGGPRDDKLREALLQVADECEDRADTWALRDRPVKAPELARALRYRAAVIRTSLEAADALLVGHGGQAQPEQAGGECRPTRDDCTCPDDLPPTPVDARCPVHGRCPTHTTDPQPVADTQPEGGERS